MTTCPNCNAELTHHGPDLYCKPCRRPVLPGRPDGNRVVVWCRHCRRDHTHGRCVSQCAHGCHCPPGSGDGHRAAHCGTGPYRNRGYIVREIRPTDTQLTLFTTTTTTTEGRPA